MSPTTPLLGAAVGHAVGPLAPGPAAGPALEPGSRAWLGAAVRQHADLVYSAALRRTGDGHLAEDVAQAVFLVLARRPGAAARSARRTGSLAGWLLLTTRYAAANALKRERRRHFHERRAARARSTQNRIPETMTAAQSFAAGAVATRAGGGAAMASSDPAEVLAWRELAPLLDDAILALPAAERAALLLRFYEERSGPDIAARLGISEAAARQRVSRGIQKLRRALERRGFAVSASVLGGLMGAYVVRAAPSRLVWTCVASATSTTAAGLSVGSAAAIAKGTIAMMHLAKIKLAAVALTASGLLAAAALAAGGAFTSQGAGGEQATARPAAPQEEGPAPGNDARYSVANNPPVVIATFPLSGETRVDPALKEIRVTFSKAMKPGNFAFAQVSDDSFPKTTDKPRYMAEERSFVLPVELKPNTNYVIRLNFPPYDSFMDEGGRKALSHLLVFQTAASSEAAGSSFGHLRFARLMEASGGPTTGPASTRPASVMRKVDPNDPVFQRARPIRDAAWAIIAQKDKNEDKWPADFEAAKAAGLDASKLPGTVRYVTPGAPDAGRDTPILFENVQWPADAEASKGVWIAFADGTVQLITDEAKFKELLKKAGL